MDCEHMEKDLYEDERTVIFDDHKELYSSLIKNSGKSGSRLIGKLSSIISGYEPEQIFELYDTSRESLKRSSYEDKEKNIFAAVILNTTKLIINDSLEGYASKLNKELSQNHDIIERYIIDTNKVYVPERSKKLKEKISKLKSHGNSNKKEIEYLESLYDGEIQKSPKRYEELSGMKSEVFCALFQMDEIDKEKKEDSTLSRFYRRDDTKRRNTKMNSIKKEFLSYAERKARDSPLYDDEYNELIESLRMVGKYGAYQEIQESNEMHDWKMTSRVLSGLCPDCLKSREAYEWADKKLDGYCWDMTDIEELVAPEIKRYNRETFFRSEDVNRYITPKSLDKGKLYVQTIKNSREIHKMIEFSMKHIMNESIDKGKRDNHLKEMRKIFTYAIGAYAVKRYLVDR